MLSVDQDSAKPYISPYTNISPFVDHFMTGHICWRSRSEAHICTITSGRGSWHLTHAMGNSHVMDLVLMGCMWSAPCQVQAEMIINTITSSSDMVKSHVMELVLTGCMWSMPCQVWAARGEPQYEHEHWWVAGLQHLTHVVGRCA